MDTNFIAFTNNAAVGDQVLGVLKPQVTVSDTLKFSNAQNGTISAECIIGGEEDCVDFNRNCSNLFVWAQEWHSGGLYVVTIKGNASNISLAGRIYTHGREMDVDIDNYSDQSHKPSRDIKLNLSTPDGSAVRWRSLMGCKPQIMNPEQKYKCVLYLPYPVGIIWNRFYQLLKILRICK